MQEILVVAGARTAFTEYGGSLAEVGATELGAIPARGALERSGVFDTRCGLRMPETAEAVGRYGLATLCIGGRQGIAAVFEAL